jgi:hypothetical protein
MTRNRKKKEKAKTYAMKLGQWVKERTSTARDRNAVAFLCGTMSTRRRGRLSAQDDLDPHVR